MTFAILRILWMLLGFVQIVRFHVLLFVVLMLHFHCHNVFLVFPLSSTISTLWNTADCQFAEIHTLSYSRAITNWVIPTTAAMITAKFNPISSVKLAMLLAKQFVRTMAQSIFSLFRFKGNRRRMNLLYNFMCFLHFIFSRSQNN